MKQTTIFHTDLPCDIRQTPHDSRHARRLTEIIWKHATKAGVEPPFYLDRMDDRIVVRELKKVAT